VRFADGTQLWFQDARRFGLLELHETIRLAEAPSLAALGPEPYPDPPPAEALRRDARGLKAAVKLFLMDQRRLAGIGNIYASEILFRAAVHPGRPAGRIALGEWERIRAATGAVLGEAVDRFGTTFSLYRTLWNEPGTFGERLFVYDRAGDPCRVCGSPIRRRVMGQRSTFFCASCQPARSSTRVRPRRRGSIATRVSAED
jgi:formamidopyrimidine-DNA glycosylase